jgi:cell pole-organizing protein PopZ
MKYGQKPAEPRMEDVLASIRRAIDESAQGQAPERLGGSMAELRVKFDAPANQGTRSSRRGSDYDPKAGSSSGQGFAGILGGKRDVGEASSRPAFRSAEPVQRQPDPAVSERDDDGQYVYDGYYGAQVKEYPEPAPEPEPYRPPGITPPRFLSPPAVIPSYRQSVAQKEGLLSEASSEATQAAFNRLAETLTRRALGERPIADVTQELLKSMLKQWLDDNLPTIVEKLVREEIERVVRRPSR